MVFTSLRSPGCLLHFDRRPEQHRFLADRLTAEHRVKTEGHGCTVDERKARASVMPGTQPRDEFEEFLRKPKIVGA